MDKFSVNRAFRKIQWQKNQLLLHKVCKSFVSLMSVLEWEANNKKFVIILEKKSSKERDK